MIVTTTLCGFCERRVDPDDIRTIEVSICNTAVATAGGQAGDRGPSRELTESISAKVHLDCQKHAIAAGLARRQGRTTFAG